jgi:ribokinase
VTVRPAPRVGVVGHAEWVEFAVVDHHPSPGEIVEASEWFEEAAGSGAVAAVQMRKLAGAATMLCALGDDELGTRTERELAGRHGVEVLAARRARPQRRAFTHLAGDRERTITVIGERLVPHGGDPLPWDRVAQLDGVYLTGGDPGAVRAARAARRLVATARAFEAVAEARVELDVLLASAADPGERVDAGRLDPPPRHVVLTAGARGGTWTAVDGRTGAWAAVAPPGPPVDAFGCGDSFAGGLTFGLGAGLGLDGALQIAARCGAWSLSGRGPYGRQLTAAEVPPLR